MLLQYTRQESVNHTFGYIQCHTNAIECDRRCVSGDIQVRSILTYCLFCFVSYISIPLAIDVELSMYLFAMLYVLWRIPQIPKLRNDGTNQQHSQTIRQFANELIELLRLGFRTYCKPRRGHRRAFMFVSVIVLMITYTTSVETRTSTTISTYVFRRTDHGALKWSSSDLGYWNGSGYLSCMCGILCVLLYMIRFQ